MAKEKILIRLQDIKGYKVVALSIKRSEKKELNYVLYFTASQFDKLEYKFLLIPFLWQRNKNFPLEIYTTSVMLESNSL